MLDKFRFRSMRFCPCETADKNTSPSSCCVDVDVLYPVNPGMWEQCVVRGWSEPCRAVKSRPSGGPLPTLDTRVHKMGQRQPDTACCSNSLRSTGGKQNTRLS